MAAKQQKPVLVTTSHRGVFFGYLNGSYKPGDAVIRLTRARNVVYWPIGQHGFLGLASDGPESGARIGPPADIELRDITCVAQCSPEAVAAFEKAPWRK